MSVTMLDLDIAWNKLDRKIAKLMENQQFIMECLETLRIRIDLLETKEEDELH